MPSNSLLEWQSNRLLRLDEVASHCIAVQGQVPVNAAFLEETLRGYVLHLSAHFQGFCRNLYTESAQIIVAAMPSALQPAAQTQFSAQLALEKGNPNYDNIKKDFNRFGFVFSLPAADPLNHQRLNDLAHLNSWRNKAAHQGMQPPISGAPTVLTPGIVQRWRVACDGLAGSLDTIMYDELQKLLGAAPW